MLSITSQAAMIFTAAMIACGQARTAAPSPKESKSLIFSHVRDTGRTIEATNLRVAMAVWDTGLVVVGVVRSKGIEYHSSTLTNGELEFLPI
ncbi:MAG: hypothetical protein R3B46_01710 [Phycisphaerales bacterium]